MTEASQAGKTGEMECGGDQKPAGGDLDVVRWRLDWPRMQFSHMDRGIESLLGYPVQSWASPMAAL